ncbi:unnamed protein product [Closterium sp. NIES-53]
MRPFPPPSTSFIFLPSLSFVSSRKRHRPPPLPSASYRPTGQWGARVWADSRGMQTSASSHGPTSCCQGVSGGRVVGRGREGERERAANASSFSPMEDQVLGRTESSFESTQNSFACGRPGAWATCRVREAMTHPAAVEIPPSPITPLPHHSPPPSLPSPITPLPHHSPPPYLPSQVPGACARLSS